jgi:hypothetical protein
MNESSEEPARGRPRRHRRRHGGSLAYLTDYESLRGEHVLDFEKTRARVEISMRSDLYPSLPATLQLLYAHLDRGDAESTPDVSRRRRLNGQASSDSATTGAVTSLLKGSRR